jgi:2-methylcitrate dehydratase PrpD
MQSISEFCLHNAGIPEHSREVASWLLLDTLSVAIASHAMEAGQIAKDYAAEYMAAGNPSTAAPLLFDGRLVSQAGAAWSLATQIDNLDGHDGYIPTKGHIGCAVVPALCAVAHQLPHLSGPEALNAMVIAYEVAARAGISLHASVSDYHTSGAWNGLGVAAMICHLEDQTKEQLRHALGIAEYHGPRSQMMREIANPSMLHDGSGMGALVGLQSAHMAAKGFTGAPAITVEDEAVSQYWQDLGDFWTIDGNYVKPYPICRWAHAALDAANHLRQQHNLQVDDIAAIEINTFHHAACLSQGMPQSTSEAQYSMSFAVATVLRYGYISAEHIAGLALHDPQTEALIARIQVNEAERHTQRFATGRWSDVRIQLTNGQWLDSGDTEASGLLGKSFDKQDLLDKFRQYAQPELGHERTEAILSAGLNLTQANSRFADFAALLYPAAQS